MLFPLLLHPIFFKYQKASETTKGSRMKFFSPVRQKVFRKTCDIPSYASKFYISDFFWNAEGFPYQFSRCYETQKKFRQNCDVTTPHPRPPKHDNFRHQKFFEMQMCSPTRFIVSVKKKFNGEWWNPLLMHKNLPTRIFLKYRTVKRLHDEVYR